ncbi:MULTISPECIES: hypothetical protein [Anaeromyxobacter]|uniref:hypothetical protein n=1 Tax=Anaeromyxobacter TaxID=161492 RepID=UPI001F5963D0|nr:MULTISPECIES: hypothetical protein [unclassified Anaeromyxobacter]
MSDLPASALDYAAVVSEYFLGLRGAGLMLSPLDEELVCEWERRGIPVAVVCRGIRRGLEQQQEGGARPPRSLRALRLAVDDEWRDYRSGRVGDAPPGPAGEEPVAASRLRAARTLLTEAGRSAPPALREGYRAAWRALEPALALAAAGETSPLARLDAALAEADARILSAWLTSLEPPVRAALGPRVRLLAGPRTRSASRAAYRDALRAHVSDAARAAGVTCLRGSV